ASYPNPRYPNAPKMKPTAMINPIIIKNSEEVEKDWEGCLSLPGIRALVPRYKNIKVQYFTREGKNQTKTFKDFIARIFQHELDHLNGKVFTDRADPKDLIMEKEYQKMMKKEAEKRGE
ncbi:MAG: peptide deformylase, partial [Candidatus Pacebacteria bacterium]|nr:peptide deformylase [Candidatus Paceibacterota bacterium]